MEFKNKGLDILEQCRRATRVNVGKPTPEPTKLEAQARLWEDPRTTRFVNALAKFARMPGYIYVASPYTKYPEGLDKAHEHVCLLTAELVKGGMSVYSPIAHSHPVAIHGGIDPKDHSLWMAQCRAMMEAATACIVLTMDGWQDSKGVQMEIKYFDEADKPLLMVDPKLLMGGHVPFVS
jgi:hypothetical protein